MENQYSESLSSSSLSYDRTDGYSSNQSIPPFEGTLGSTHNKSSKTHKKVTAQSEIFNANVKYDGINASNNTSIENDNINDNPILNERDRRDNHTINDCCDKTLPLSPSVTLRTKQKTKPPLSPMNTSIETSTKTPKSTNAPVAVPKSAIPSIQTIKLTTPPPSVVSKSSPRPEYTRIEIYEKRPLILYIPLQYESYQGNRLLGVEHGIDEKGRLVVVNFAKHPKTGEMM